MIRETGITPAFCRCREPRISLGLHESLRDFCSVGQRSRARCSMALRVVRTCAETAPDSTQHAARTSGRHRVRTEPPARESQGRGVGCASSHQDTTTVLYARVLCVWLSKTFLTRLMHIGKFVSFAGIAHVQMDFQSRKMRYFSATFKKYLIVFYFLM